MTTLAQSAGFEAWQGQICRTFVPLRARCAGDPAGFRGDVSPTHLGAVLLTEVSASAAQVERTPRLIRADDPEFYKLGVQVQGSSVIEQGGREAVLRPGDLALYDTSRPYRIGFSDDFAMTIAMFPRGLVHLPAQEMATMTARRVNGTVGLGAVISHLVRSVCTRADATRATPLGDAIVDLVTATFTPAGETAASDCPGSQRTLAMRVRTYVDARLAEPGLTPRSVADAHHVSVRHLQKVFEAEGITVSTLIRTRRLEQCRRALSDDRQRHLSIAQIGSRWGFPDAAHFSRAFRSAYGRSPREYRATGSFTGRS